FYPELDLGILLLSNWMNPKLFELADRIVDQLTDAKPAPVPEGPAPGFYLCDQTGMALEVPEASESPRCFLMADPAQLSGNPQEGWRPLRKPAEFLLTQLDPRTLAVSFGEGPLLFRRWESRPVGQPLQPFIGTYFNSLTGERHVIRIDADGSLEVIMETA